MKKDRLYKVNKGNKAGLTRNLFWDGSQMSMLTDTLTNTGNTAGPQGVNLSLLGLPGNQAFEHSFSEKTLPLDWYNSKPANVADYLTNQMPDPSKVDLTKLSIPKGASGGSGGGGGNKALTDALVAGIGTVGTMAGNAIGNGYESAAADAIGTLASTGLGIAGTAMFGPIGGAVGSAIGSVLGGVTHGLIGMKTNQEALSNAKAGTSYYNNFKSDAGSFDDVQGPQTQLAITDPYKGGLLKKGKAKRMNNALRKDRAEAFEHAFGEVENNVDNLVSEQINDLLAQSYAMGGDMNSRNIFAGGGPKKLKKPRHYYSTDYGDGIVTTTVETPDEKYEETVHGNDTVYGNYSDPMWFFKKHKANRRGNETPTPEYLDYQRKFREAKDGATKVGTIGWQLTKDFMNDVFGTHFALGGDMQTNGSDFTTGLSYIKEGGTHEENPYEGVQMGVDPEGTPNLVEEGERIYNDYVYSNRIYADGGTLEKFHLSKKKKITFSDLAGLLEKEAAERPNDPISRASLSIQLDRLADEQERQKQENERRSAEEAFAALSPEEQQAAMQEIAQQEQMAQQQAMEEQMAMQQQAVPEEAMSPEDAYQQEMLAQQMAGAPMMSAYGGKLYGYGGDLSESGNNLFLFGGKEKRKQLQAAAEAQKKRERNAADVKRRQSAYDREQRRATERNRKATLEAERKRTEDIMRKRDEARINVENEAIYTSKYKNAVNFLKSTHPEIKAVEELASILAKDTASTTPQAAYNKFVNGNKRNNFRALTSIGVSEEEAFDIMGGNVSDSVKALKNWDDWTTSWGKSPSGLKTRTRAGENTQYLAADGIYYPSEQEAINVNKRLGKGVQRAASAPTASTSAPKQNTGTGATTTRGNTSTSGGNRYIEQARRNMYRSLQEESAVPTVATPTYTGLTGNTGYVVPQGDVAVNPYIAQVDSPAVAGQPQVVAPQAAAQGTPQAPAQAAPAPEPPKSLKENIFNALGIYTEEGMNKWLSENGLKPVEDWDKVLENEPFMTAFRNDIGMDNPLYHALGMKYDFGQYVPSKGAGVTFPSITQGNWDNQTYEGWKDSKDPGWLEAVENWKNELGDNWAATVAGYNRDQIADALRKTKAFQRGTQWLQEDENNRLRYLTELYTNNETPEKAKRYAEKFVTRDANGNIVWKQGAARDYNTIFNNPSGRAANPGTYWHTPIEALREKKINNYVWGDDGWELMATAVPENWKRINSYSWSGKEDNTDYTNNYYRNPAAVDENGKPIKGNGAADGEGEGEEEGYWEATPNYDKAANLRYLGLAGPALALGLQALGVGKPDPSGLDASLAMATNPAVLAKPHLIGDYMRYKPIDRLFYANQLQANSRATDRGIMNTSGGNRGTAMAGLLGNGLNAQTALANMDMQAENTNWGRYGQTKDFNRGTNIFNAQALNQNSMFNAEQLNRNKQFGAQMSANIAAQKMAADAGWNASKYKNLGEFFSGLSSLGNEATQRNWLAELAADGVFGQLSPRTNTGKSQGLLTFEWKPGKKPGATNAANGGKLNKKRRG